jgi:glutaredoxin
LKIRIFSKKDCHLCDTAKEVLRRLSVRYSIAVEEIDIEQDPEAFEIYHEEIPVIFLEDRKLFKYRVDEPKLEKALQAASMKSQRNTDKH